MPAGRVIIIGLDGADERILSKLITAGSCPHIASFVSNGFYGKVLSTVPPLTPPAWTTMLTGLNPGRHAIFDFVQPAEDGRFVMTNASRRRGRTIFDYCLRQGAGVIDLFVPFTYPPPDDGAVHISGLGTPSGESDFIRPHAIRDEMLAKYPALKQMDLCESRTLFSLPVTLDSEIQMKSALAMELMGRQEWRIAMVVFNATDLAQHFYLKYFDEGHPNYDPSSPRTHGKVIANVYKFCDEFVGRCIGMVGDDGIVALVSDHGCQPLTSSIAKDTLLKDILQAAGLLKIIRRHDDDRPSKGAEVAHKGIHTIKRKTPHWVRHAFNVLFGGARARISRALEAVPFGDEIDWGNTKAFVGPGAYGVCIYVNLKGRFPHGSVEPGGEEESVKDKVLKAVGNLKLPDGRPLAAYIAKANEIYWGDALGLGPDVVVLFNEPGAAFSGAELADGVHLGPPQTRPGSDLVWSGTHAVNGVFGLWGKGVAKGNMPGGVTLADVAPTILHLMGLKVPSGLDGHVIMEADSEGREPVYVTAEGEICKTSGGLSPGEEKDIYENLKSVGYLH